jgi:four helix bundle protein
MAESILLEKSYAFALRIVKLSEYLAEERKEFILSRRILDSGTAIGALVEEGKQGHDRRDFAAVLSGAAKQAFKTNYWLRLLRDSNYMTEPHAQSFLDDCIELQKMLISSLKTTRAEG